MKGEGGMKKKILLGLGIVLIAIAVFYFVSHCIGQAEQRTKKDADSEEIRLICIFFAV